MSLLRNPPLWLRVLACVLCGLGHYLISPPMNWWWIHWVLFVPVYWALMPVRHKRNAWLGYLAGWVGMFTAFFWLAETVVRFSNLPYSLSLLTVVIFATAFGLPMALTFGLTHWLRDRIGTAWVFVVPAVHVTLENCGPALFPYFYGVTQYRMPQIWQLASITGVISLTYLIFLVNALLGEGLYRWREGRPQPRKAYAFVTALMVAVIAFGHWRHGAVENELAEARSIEAAIIQQDVTMEVRMDQSVWEAIESWVSRTGPLVKDGPDLVVWPEGSVHVNPDSERRFKALGGDSPRGFFENMAQTGDFHLLIGGGTVERGRDAEGNATRTSFNSTYNFTRDGHLGQRYDKMVPLPFGEYIPLADTFPWLKEVIQGPGDFKAGETVTVFEAEDQSGESYTYTTPICYEGILSEQMEKMSKVDLFVNITNDAWFGDTACPHQHAMLTAVQAIQYGRPLLRIAYSGISWVVEPHGDILYETAPFTEAASVETIRLGAVDTVYRRIGWIFPWLCMGVSLIALVIARRREPSAEE